MKKVLALVLAFASMTGALTACKGSSGAKKSASVPQIANFYMQDEPATMDPTRADDSVTNEIVMEANEGLVRMHNGKLEPAGAESWSTSSDGLTWTFKLRDNKYSDGTEVVAQDYVNAVQRIFDPQVNCNNATIFYCIRNGEAYNTGKAKKEDVGVKAPDSKTLVFTLNEPIPYFEQLVDFAVISPIKSSATEGSKDTSFGSSAAGMVFSGPFYVASWTRGSDVVLKKNPHYWDAKSVKLSQINYKLAKEDQTQQQMFQSGQLDLLQNVPDEFVTQMKPQIDNKSVTLYHGYSPSSAYVCFNNKDPQKTFTNANIRKAFSLAIDRNSLVSNVLKKGKVSYGLVPFGISCGNTIFRDKVSEPLKDSLSQDPKALLQKGLQELGRDPSQKLTVTFLQGNSTNQTKTQAEYYQNQWETKLGVNVKIDMAPDSATFNQTVAKGIYQVCQTGWGADYNDPMTFMQCWVTGDGNNAAFFSNPQYDQLVNACKTISDQNTRLENFEKAEKILIDDQAGIAPITYGYVNNLIAKRLKGAIINGSGGPGVEFKYAYIAG